LLPRYPQAIALENSFCLIATSREEDLFLKHARTSHRSRLFLIAAQHFFEITIAIRRRNEFSTFSARLEIKDDINFFLDFDFQPLYTFINCGFLLRTAHP
jgi:hypothetical protein